MALTQLRPFGAFSGAEYGSFAGKNPAPIVVLQSGIGGAITGEAIKEVPRRQKRKTAADRLREFREQESGSSVGDRIAANDQLQQLAVSAQAEALHAVEKASALAEKAPSAEVQETADAALRQAQQSAQEALQAISLAADRKASLERERVSENVRRASLLLAILLADETDF